MAPGVVISAADIEFLTIVTLAVNPLKVVRNLAMKARCLNHQEAKYDVQLLWLKLPMGQELCPRDANK